MKTKKIIKEAVSKPDGIIFYSNNYPLVGVMSFQDKSGKVQTKKVIRIEQSNRITLREKQIKLLLEVMLIVIGAITNIGCFMASIYFVLFVSTHLTIVLKNDKATGKYHAAEHKAIAAYEKYQRVPNLEEVRTFSRFSPKCGSRFILNGLAKRICFTIDIYVIFQNIIMGIFLLLIIEMIMYIAKKTGCYKYLQIFVTSKPTDKELEVAIAGLQQFEVMEQELTSEHGISIIKTN